MRNIFKSVYNFLLKKSFFVSEKLFRFQILARKALKIQFQNTQHRFWNLQNEYQFYSNILNRIFTEVKYFF